MIIPSFHPFAKKIHECWDWQNKRVNGDKLNLGIGRTNLCWFIREEDCH